MRKPKVIPLVISIVTAAVFLFGGFALYKQYAVAAPLTDKLEAMPGIEAASKPAISQDDLNVKLQLTADASLRETYNEAMKQATEAAGSRKINITLESNSNETLEQLWYSAMFEVAEAMEIKTYSTIPDAMNKIANTVEGVTATTEMDENNVYITIRAEQAGATKFVVLPRIANQLEVW
ncbi:hypothetical protein ACX1C1_18750 [Paenibacillus sp. strain BS8-2]